MTERLCPQDFQHKRDVCGMVSTLVKRAKPSYLFCAFLIPSVQAQATGRHRFPEPRVLF
jgi:hypothetical protein